MKAERLSFRCRLFTDGMLLFFCFFFARISQRHKVTAEHRKVLLWQEHCAVYHMLKG